VDRALPDVRATHEHTTYCLPDYLFASVQSSCERSKHWQQTYTEVQLVSILYLYFDIKQRELREPYMNRMIFHGTGPGLGQKKKKRTKQSRLMILSLVNEYVDRGKTSPLSARLLRHLGLDYLLIHIPGLVTVVQWPPSNAVESKRVPSSPQSLINSLLAQRLRQPDNAVPSDLYQDNEL